MTDSLTPQAIETPETMIHALESEGKQTGRRDAPTRCYTPLVLRPEGGALMSILPQPTDSSTPPQDAPICAWADLAGQFSCPPCDFTADYWVRFRGGCREVLVCMAHTAWLRPTRHDIVSMRGSRRAAAGGVS